MIQDAQTRKQLRQSQSNFEFLTTIIYLFASNKQGNPFILTSSLYEFL